MDSNKSHLPARALQVWECMWRRPDQVVTRQAIGTELSVTATTVRRALTPLLMAGVVEYRGLRRIDRGGNPADLFGLTSIGVAGLPEFGLEKKLQPAPSWYRLLQYLSRRGTDNPATVRDISLVIGVSPVHTYALVQKLIHAGHAEENGRLRVHIRKPRILYRLTDEGLEAARETTLDPGVYEAWNPVQ